MHAALLLFFLSPSIGKFLPFFNTPQKEPEWSNKERNRRKHRKRRCIRGIVRNSNRNRTSPLGEQQRTWNPGLAHVSASVFSVTSCSTELLRLKEGSWGWRRSTRLVVVGQSRQPGSSADEPVTDQQWPTNHKQAREDVPPEKMGEDRANRVDRTRDRAEALINERQPDNAHSQSKNVFWFHSWAAV
jgi:hypothetical protein